MPLNIFQSATTVLTNSVSAKISEAASKAVTTFGNSLPFNKFTANSPLIAALEAAQMKGKELVAGTEKAISDKIAGAVAGTEAQPTAKQINGMAVVNVVGQKLRAHKVILEEIKTKESVAFDVMPEIQETNTTEYEAVAPAQFPGAFQKFKGNATTQWTLNVMLVSRNAQEASKNYRIMMRLRGWMKPFFGENTQQKFKDQLGAPPPILELRGLRNLIGPTPVVITAMNWTWPKDVDYIATDIPSPADGKPIPFPTVISFPISLVESYSIQQFNNFSLEDYRAGNMKDAFSKVPVSASANEASSEMKRVAHE